MNGIQQTLKTNPRTDPVVNGFFRGLVVDNANPDIDGRVKVKVYPFYEDASEDEIPWAEPATAIVAGGAIGEGVVAIPKENSWVWCFFDAGDIKHPVYFAECKAAGDVSSIMETNYPDRYGIDTDEVSVYVDRTANVLRIVPKGSIIVEIGTTVLRVVKETLMTIFNSHKHIDAEGRPTTPPDGVTVSDGDLTTKVKLE